MKHFGFCVLLAKYFSNSTVNKVFCLIYIFFLFSDIKVFLKQQTKKGQQQKKKPLKL